MIVLHNWLLLLLLMLLFGVDMIVQHNWLLLLLMLLFGVDMIVQHNWLLLLLLLLFVVDMIVQHNWQSHSIHLHSAFIKPKGTESDQAEMKYQIDQITQYSITATIILDILLVNVALSVISVQYYDSLIRNKSSIMAL